MTMFVHILERIFVHFSLQIISKTLIVCGCSLANGRFSSLHRITIGLIFGDGLGHFMTLICFFLSHSFVALTVCCVLLSCWEIQKWPTFSLVVEGRTLALRIARYMPPSIHLLTMWSCPVPRPEKHPQTIMIPLSCMMVRRVFLRS